MSNPTVLTLHDITYTYPDSPDSLFSDISVTFPKGWTAVLGDNGIGKTTLMKLAMGRLTPDSGAITPTPANLVIAYCPQQTDIVPDGLDDFGADWSGEAIAIRQSLDIGDDWPYRYGTLSGGEAKRLQIACSLMSAPDVLICDEPTNHVDTATRRAIIGTLRDFQGIGILVSHDVELIDALCARCAIFERRHVNGKNVTEVTTYPGNYSETSKQVSLRDHSDRQLLNDARRDVKRLQGIRTQRFHEVQKVETLKKRGDRINPKDHDALERQKGARMGSLDGNPAKSYAQLDGRFTMARHHLDEIATAAKRYDGAFHFDVEPSNRKELVRLQAGVITFGQDEVQTLHDDSSQYSHMSIVTANAAHHTSERPGHSRNRKGVIIPMLSVGPQDHIGISGPNGRGKTTVVQSVLRRLRDNDIRYLSIAQNTTLNDAREAIDRLNHLGQERQAAALSLYARLNADPNRLRNGETPSPGQLRKLLLVLGIMQHPQLIIMDEPTNHLDLNSKRALAQALCEYPGSLLVVSHETWFLDKTTSIRWTVQ